MVLSATIGALGALGSAGIGAISANAQSGKAFGRMLYAMQEQARLNYDYGQKSLLNSPTSTRQGLQNAGFNPMLAVQNATQGANSSWTSSGAYQQDQQTDAITNGVRNGTDMAQLAINQQQTDSNVKLNTAQARNVTAEAIGKEIHNQYLNKREEAELGQIGAETDKLIRETSYYDQLAENMEAQRRLQEMGINLDYGARIYGANSVYNASKYSADVEAETKRGTITTKNPFGFGGVSKYYPPDDVIRKPHRGNLKYYDSYDRKYWRNYY